MTHDGNENKRGAKYCCGMLLSTRGGVGHATRDTAHGAMALLLLLLLLLFEYPIVGAWL